MTGPARETPEVALAAVGSDGVPVQPGGPADVQGPMAAARPRSPGDFVVRLARHSHAALVHPWLPLLAAWVLLVALAARSDPFVVPLVLLAFGGAFVSGLVGVGGAIIMIPLLLYVPPALGYAPLDIHTVAGIAIVQVTAASLAGVAGHREGVDGRLFLAVGPAMILASFAGGLVSAGLSTAVLEAVFAMLATIAAVLMIGFRSRTAPDTRGAVSFSRPKAVATGLVVGLGAGLVGAGGAFVLAPVMLLWLHVPVRVTVGTALAVVAASSIAALLGKAATDQVDWIYGLTLVAGALPGARLGSHVSRRTRTDRLVLCLGIVIALVAARMWVEVLL